MEMQKTKDSQTILDNKNTVTSIRVHGFKLHYRQ